MNLHDILTTKRDVEAAMEIAGRGELRWLKLIEELDRLGYDIVRREKTAAPQRTFSQPASEAEPMCLIQEQMLRRDWPRGNLITD